MSSTSEDYVDSKIWETDLDKFEQELKERN